MSLFSTFSLYVHLPWCISKCPYCDFNSHAVGKNGIAIDVEKQYINALLNDWEYALARHPHIKSRQLCSIFFGGGTPSLFSPASINTLMSRLKNTISLAPNIEVTMEANPGTVNGIDATEHGISALLQGFHSAGINRLSLGVQSFSNKQLAKLGRIHNSDTAKLAIECAKQVFAKINIDLMFGLPAQTMDEALADINTALSFATTHLSCYQLTIEPNTEFHHLPPSLPPDDDIADMAEAISSHLLAAGFNHYETSAFAKADYACLHNLNYWNYGDYLAIGAGAHGKITQQHDDGTLTVLREVRWKHPASYMKKTMLQNPIAERTTISKDERVFEWMMNALRLTDGFWIRDFEARTGVLFATLAKTIDPLISEGLLAETFAANCRRISPTMLGRNHLNRILQSFLVAR